MNSVDSIQINFNPDNLLVLNIILALLMFSIALDIRKDDFEMLWKNPKPAIVGMIGQLIILPLVTIGLVFVFNPPPSVALGMVAISACPGGNNSNYTTHLARGRTTSCHRSKVAAGRRNVSSSCFASAACWGQPSGRFPATARSSTHTAT